jgi:hypothetical protein
MIRQNVNSSLSGKIGYIFPLPFFIWLLISFKMECGKIVPDRLRFTLKKKFRFQGYYLNSLR